MRASGRYQAARKCGATIPGMFEVGPDPTQAQIYVCKGILAYLDGALYIHLLFFSICFIPCLHGILHALRQSSLRGIFVSNGEVMIDLKRSPMRDSLLSGNGARGAISRRLCVFVPLYLHEATSV